MEVKWKSDKTKYDDCIKRRQQEVKQQKKKAKPERLSMELIEKWVRENQTI